MVSDVRSTLCRFGLICVRERIVRRRSAQASESKQYFEQNAGVELPATGTPAVRRSPADLEQQ